MIEYRVVKEILIDDNKWTSLQGGKPKVSKEGSLTVVTHNYPQGGGMVVRSHIPVERYGTVKIMVSGTSIEVPAALVRRLHGEPCERTSIRAGGEGYKRDK